MTRNNIVALVVLVLVVGLVVGWVLGRWDLERRWAEPTTIGEADVRRSSEGDADPTPAAGTRVLPAMPIQRSRAALAELVEGDPVQVRVGSVGRSDGEMFLHLTLVNHGTCAVREVDGVAYGFDAWGRSAKLNRAGEHYVAFHATDLDLGAGGSAFQEYPLHHPDIASIALAQVDRVGCADGTSWSRHD
jgi:hypothetical protein